MICKIYQSQHGQYLLVTAIEGAKHFIYWNKGGIIWGHRLS